MATPTSNSVAITGLSLTGLSNTEASLISGGKWGGDYGTGAALTYSFPGQNGSSATHDYYYGYEWSSGWYYLNSPQVDAVERALDVIEGTVNVSFTRVADNSSEVGELRFAGSNYVSAYAHAYSPDSSAVECGDVWFSPNWLDDANGFGEAVPGTYAFASILHEVGHALGLKHPFEPGDSGKTLSDDYDHYQFTQMSYDTRPGASGADTWADMYPTTFMISDLIALEKLYGKPTSANNGTTNYHFYSTNQYWQTIVDSGGIDTITYHSSGDNCRIDLSNATFSQLGRPIEFGNGDVLYNNVALGPSTVIENATGGEGSDTLIGNARGNKLTGNGGNDVLTGSGGADNLAGGAGADKVNGGAGNDKIAWGADDAVNGGSGTDKLMLTAEDLNLVFLSKKVLSVEQIDMRGGGARLFTLNRADVLELSTATDNIRIFGDIGDRVDISGNFSRGSIAGGFRTYKLGGSAVLTVETDVLVA